VSQIVDSILALHYDKPNIARHDVYICNECQKTQPCPTIRAVDSEQILVRRRNGHGWRSPASGHTYHWISETEAVR
jgi:hypothetical protein